MSKPTRLDELNTARCRLKAAQLVLDGISKSQLPGDPDIAKRLVAEINPLFETMKAAFDAERNRIYKPRKQ